MSGVTVTIVGGFLLAVLAVVVWVLTARDRLTVPIRILISVMCMPVAAFSVFGFLASFEPGVAIGWKIGYATLFVVLVATGIAPWIPKSSRLTEPATDGLETASRR